MKTKTLETIQKLCKVGKVLSKIIFICCIVGFVCCLIGIGSVALGEPTIKFGSVTLHGIIGKEAEMTVGTLLAAITTGAIICAGEAVLAKFSEHYFTRELKDGTPFTFDGAKELLRLGILAICIPIGTEIIAGIAHGIFAAVMEGVADMDMGTYGSVFIGITMILMALICKHGAEISTGKAAELKEQES